MKEKSEEIAALTAKVKNPAKAKVLPAQGNPQRQQKAAKKGKAPSADVIARAREVAEEALVAARKERGPNSPDRGYYPEQDEAGKPKRKIGVPFVATAEQRSRVVDFVLVGSTRPVIAMMLGISVETLERHFRPELERSILAINAGIAKGVAQRALEGDQKAAEFWLHTRAGFVKKRDDDSDGEGGRDLNIIGGLPD